jgi:integrase
MKVNYTNNNGSVRIRISQRGCKRITWHPGLEYTDTNLKAAQALCRRIEFDILAGNFDPTFARYELVKKESFAQPTKEPTILNYWLEWADFHRDKLSPTTYLSELNTVTKLLERYPKLLINEAKVLVKMAPTHYAKRTFSNCWKWLRACFNWHIANETLEDNPFNPLPRGFKSFTKKSDIGIFSKSQKEIIIQEFQKECPHYAPFVKFLFLTGCRPEEAIALTWDDVKPDYIIIDKAFTRGILKETKTKKDRKIPLNETLREFLSSHYFASIDLHKPHFQVFPTPYAGYINLSDFGTNKWKPLIESLVFYGKLPEYLSLYHCRHTFISECLNAKIPIQQVAKWVGNSPEMIWRHYAGVIDEYSLPE